MTAKDLIAALRLHEGKKVFFEAAFLNSSHGNSGGSGGGDDDWKEVL